MKITVIGAGYVGLVSAACFADIGHSVICVERDRVRLDMLEKGEIPIYEPGLAGIVSANAAAGRLRFTNVMAEAVAQSDIVLIAVGTPSRPGDGLADISQVYAAANEIAPALTGFTVVVTKSTVPVGTGDEIDRIIARVNPEADVAVVSNPEFLREGSAIKDFMQPDRIVVGTESARASQVMQDAYAPLGTAAERVVMTGRRTAELTKYAANSFLAMKVTFINEIADLCERVGADVTDVARGMGLDARIGRQFLNAGPGVGGSCFPKDTLALVKTAQDADSPLRLVETTVSVNDQRKRAMAKKVIRSVGGSVRGKTIAILGLTFKPNTDDVRESPALPIITALQDAGARIRAFDPEGRRQAEHILSNVAFGDDAYAAASGADALVIVTEWAVFKDLELKKLKKAMAGKVIVDLRNLLDGAAVRAAGFRYTGIGHATDGSDGLLLLQQASAGEITSLAS